MNKGLLQPGKAGKGRQEQLCSENEQVDTGLGLCVTVMSSVPMAGLDPHWSGQRET